MTLFNPIPNYRTLSIMLTFQCTAECKYCGTLSSPKERTWLPMDLAFSSIDQAAKAGFKVVVFTGGEATLGHEKLFDLIHYSSRKGMSTRLVTNAYWAVTRKAATEKISKLLNAGLNEINYSTGDEHARFVPVKNVIRAVEASAAAGLNTFVMVESNKEKRITRKTIEQDPDFIEIKRIFPKVAVVVEESPWMPLDPSVHESYKEQILINEENLPFRTGCDSILTTPTLEADGSIYACCGIGSRLIPELRISNAKEKNLIEAIKIAESDFLKQWIKVEGTEKILAWAATKDPSIKWENMYAHRCQACLRIYSDPKVREVIKKFYHEKIPDVLFNEWLIHSYNPN